MKEKEKYWMKKWIKKFEWTVKWKRIRMNEWVNKRNFEWTSKTEQVDEWVKQVKEGKKNKIRWINKFWKIKWDKSKW